jgi:hypothetical protein
MKWNVRSKISVGSVFIALVLLIWASFFAFLFINCIKSYIKYDLNHFDLIYGELTFQKYEKISQKAGAVFEIYFEEYEEPFAIDNITSKRADKTLLGELRAGDSVALYFCEKSVGKYMYEICEMKADAGEILNLSDYVAENQNNQMVGMFVVPILGLLGIVLGVKVLLWLWEYRGFYF